MGGVNYEQTGYGIHVLWLIKEEKDIDIKLTLSGFALCKYRINNKYNKNLIEFADKFKEYYSGTFQILENLRNLISTSTLLNQIFYGPPGTGKTYQTISEAVRIVDKDFYLTNKGDRPAIKDKFDELKNNKQIVFITFHQSFSYEEFVEGIKPIITSNSNISYEV